jgi:hypothetical protein
MELKLHEPNVKNVKIVLLGCLLASAVFCYMKPTLISILVLSGMSFLVVGVAIGISFQKDEDNNDAEAKKNSFYRDRL